MMSLMRLISPSVKPRKYPATIPRIVPKNIVISMADEADLQRVAAAVEQADGHVTAVGVGSEEVTAQVPGRADRDARSG